MRMLSKRGYHNPFQNHDSKNMLSIRGTNFITGWASAELFHCSLSLRGNVLITGWAYPVMFQSRIFPPNRILFSKILCYRPLTIRIQFLQKKYFKKIHACTPYTSMIVFFGLFFAETETITKACNTRFLKILFDSAEMLNIFAHAQHAMKSVPRMLSMRRNSFRVCSAWIVHEKTVHILPLAEHARKFVPPMLSMR
jgi:hypothetical protein